MPGESDRDRRGHRQLPRCIGIGGRHQVGLAPAPEKTIRRFVAIVPLRAGHLGDLIDVLRARAGAGR